MNISADEKTLHLTRARKAVSDATLVLLEKISDLEEIVAAESYQRGHDDGVAWFNQEIKRVTRETSDPEPIPNKPYVLTEVDRIMQDSIVSFVTDSPGLRTIDITNKVISLPVKPALTEKSVRLTINRLKGQKKIEDKAGRWYLTGAKPPAQAFQVMTYLPDGSKYLAADVIK